MEEMPRKSAAEFEAECLRLLAMDPHTRGIKRVEIIRTYPKGTGFFTQSGSSTDVGA